MCALHLTQVHMHSSEHTHTVKTHPEQMGVRCLAQGSHLRRGIEGGENAGYSLPPPTIPARPETRTRNHRVTSLTLYPLGHDFPQVSTVQYSTVTNYIYLNTLHQELHLF